MATGPMSFEKPGLTAAEANAVVGNGYCREQGQAHRVRNCVNDVCKEKGTCIRTLQHMRYIGSDLCKPDCVRCRIEDVPGANCVTRADGACISEKQCMHTPPTACSCRATEACDVCREEKAAGSIVDSMNGNTDLSACRVASHSFADHDDLRQAMQCKTCNPVVEIQERKEESRSAWLKQEEVSGEESVAFIADKLVNTDRKSTYGHPYDNHKRIADLWNSFINGRKHGGDLTPQDVCTLMILLKVARLENGYHRDSVIDICGYGKCLDMIEAESKRRDVDYL